MIQNNLDSFLSPASIAVVGASSNPDKIGAVPVRYLVDHGYDGALYAINPNGGQIHGLPAFASLLAVNQPIDLAIFAIPASRAEAALEDAIASGVKNIVMFSAGFAETGQEGSVAQDRISSKAQAAGIRILGPNCLGFMNIARSVYATFSPVLSVGLAKPGPIGIVSQSGAFGAYAYAMAQRRGVGLSKWITTGNESDIDIADCIAWMAGDPDTKVIMAYLEGCRNGVKLRRALELARAAGKPVVIVRWDVPNLERRRRHRTPRPWQVTMLSMTPCFVNAASGVLARSKSFLILPRAWPWLGRQSTDAWVYLRYLAAWAR